MKTDEQITGRTTMQMKFPCDACGKLICFSFCNKFEEYAKIYTKSAKVKRKVKIKQEIDMDCPWSGVNGCELRSGKTCSVKTNKCTYVERVLNILTKEFGVKARKLLSLRHIEPLQAFISGNCH